MDYLVRISMKLRFHCPGRWICFFLGGEGEGKWGLRKWNELERISMVNSLCWRRFGRCYCLFCQRSERMFRGGFEGGVRLTLRADPKEFLPFLPLRGSLLMIHETNRLPDSSTDEFLVTPGVTTYIALYRRRWEADRKRNTHIKSMMLFLHGCVIFLLLCWSSFLNLHTPYESNCHDNWPNWTRTIFREQVLSKMSFSRETCLNLCYNWCVDLIHWIALDVSAR